MKKILLIMVGIALLAVGGYIVLKPKPVVETQITSAPADQTITMDAGSFYYSVKEIKAKVGDKIKIVLTAKDMMHNLNIDELNVKSETVKAGETTEFEFTADKTGTFEYYCAIGSHRKNGQIGKLIVE